MILVRASPAFELSFVSPPLPRAVLNLNFQKKTFFQRGNFPAAYSNGSLINDPWASSKTPLIAPFDQVRLFFPCFCSSVLMILSLDRHSSDFLPQNERRSWVRRIFLSTKARARAEADRRVCSRFVTSQRNRRLLERRSFQALEEREPSRSCSEVLLGQEERLVPYLALWRRDQRSSFGRRLGEDGESTASRFFFFFSSFPASVAQY